MTDEQIDAAARACYEAHRAQDALEGRPRCRWKSALTAIQDEYRRHAAFHLVGLPTELIGVIAQEGHTMGRIYAASGEKRSPVEEFRRVEEMVERKLRENAARMFPIQSDRRYGKPHPTSIPWEMADRAYSRYSARYGQEQSLERMAERGGFGPQEMDEFLPGWIEQLSELSRLRKAAADLAARIRALPLAPDTHTGTRQAWVRENAARLAEGREPLPWK